MFLRVAPTVLFVISALLGIAAVAAYFCQPDTPGATVDEPDREFSSLLVGKNEISFRLNNPTAHKVRVVGYQFC